MDAGALESLRLQQRRCSRCEPSVYSIPRTLPFPTMPTVSLTSGLPHPAESTESWVNKDETISAYLIPSPFTSIAMALLTIILTGMGIPQDDRVQPSQTIPLSHHCLGLSSWCHKSGRGSGRRRPTALLWKSPLLKGNGLRIRIKDVLRTLGW